MKERGRLLFVRIPSAVAKTVLVYLAPSVIGVGILHTPRHVVAVCEICKHRVTERSSPTRDFGIYTRYLSQHAGCVHRHALL